MAHVPASSDEETRPGYDNVKEVEISEHSPFDLQVNDERVPSEENMQRFLSRSRRIHKGRNIEEYIMELIELAEEKKGYKDYGQYERLCRAAEDKDWHAVKKFIENHPEALNAIVSEYSQTILHFVVKSENIEIVQYIVERMDPNALELADVNGATALSYSATVGNTKAAEFMVQRNCKLPNIPDFEGNLPLHHAARFGHEDTVRLLLLVTAEDEDLSLFTGESGVILVENLITSNLYGIALELLKHNPKLAREQLDDRKRVLEKLAQKPLGFASGSQLGFWQHLIYKCIPDDSSLPNVRAGDVEDPEKSSKDCFSKCKEFGFVQRTFATCGSMCQKLYVVLYNLINQLVPGIKSIHDTKLMHKQTCELVKLMCEGVTWNFKEALNSLKSPILTAARLGIQEIVHEIIKVYSLSAAFLDDDEHNIYQIAVLHRQEKVFSLIYTKGLGKDWVASFPDRSSNNILHLAGRLVPSSRVSASALQMQRELQWYKVVEKFVHPSLQEELNSDNLTPREVFTKEHKELVKTGQDWIKDTATSCSVVAALIITMAFAAAITVPGGNDNHGKPNYLTEKAFLIFALSNAMAFFFSSTSVLMFLGILTSRYSEVDFLESLPRKMMIGLITLLLSITAMMLAFGATLQLLVFHPLNWNNSSIVLACLPVTLFALLQFPLLVEIVRSTYGPSFIQPRK